ncbi:A/G-specific adenine glycosylase [compost metagenome]
MFWNSLLRWFQSNARNYLWRQTKNPFHVLVAEFLLQQTHVRKVEEVYKTLITKYPSPEDLAVAEIKEIEEIIRPIGLVYRAERLKRCAEIIMKKYKGRVPCNLSDLKSLPGVGDYIANAVMCYGCGLPTVPIDTNVIRIFRRYFGLISDKSRPRNDRFLAEKIRSLYPVESTRNENLAILDLAGTICTVNKPKCCTCPLRKNCIKNFN